MERGKQSRARSDYLEMPLVGSLYTPVVGALKRSFDMEDAEDVPAFSPSSPPHSPLGPSLPGIILAAGNGEGRRAGGPIQPSYQSLISLSSDPSPAQSPVLKTRIGSSLSFNRGTVHLARANGSHLTRVSSFQTRLNPNGFSSSLGPGSDNESLHSSSSSLECPTPIKGLPNTTPPPESPGIGVTQLPSPMLKKFFSHGNVFHSEADRPAQQVSKETPNRGSLPALDLHIAEDPGASHTLCPTQSSGAAATQSPCDQNCIAPLPKAGMAKTKDSSVPLLEFSQLTHVTPPALATRQTVKLQKFPISLDGLIEKMTPESAPRPLPRAQIHVNLSASPGSSRQCAEITKEDRVVVVGCGFPSPSSGRFPGTASSASPPPETSFPLIPSPQIGQVACQPAFLGATPIWPTQGTPVTAGPREHGSPTAKGIDSSPSREASRPRTTAPASGAKEDPLTLASRSLEAFSEKKESQGKASWKEGRCQENQCGIETKACSSTKPWAEFGKVQN
uniref:Uncharacterized protein n=1 Tax=Sphaerodactylus townsendi TaxID=933632 RepID=A0ACB8FK80_9SAUR